ncbi:MAG: deoxyribose-phosphate aldolase [Bacteroidia bacterium]|nr:deoxyribose-phosphate aldolase [Bacteroidia bacterium]
MEINLAAHIEHTLLKPTATREDIIQLCREADDHAFYGVCVPPYYVQLAKKTLGVKSSVKVVTVVGFPLGYSTVGSKVEEVKKAFIDGADEIDMVMNIAAFKSGDVPAFTNDLSSVVTACHLQNKVVKIIIETAYLSEPEIIEVCKICTECGVDFVKTSTGFADKGATVEAVKIMRQILPAKIKIKAAGGIKDAAFALELIAAGAERIGASRSIEMVASNDSIQ